MMVEHVLFDPEKEGYLSCRVPGLIVGRGNTVLATVEARPGNGGDYDFNDILMRRSADGGKTWGPVAKLVDHADYGDGPVSNFVMVAEPDGAIHALFCHDYARVFQMRSDDGGETFTTPVDITDVFKGYAYPWRVVATGPGHGTRLRNGRLIVPIWMSDSSVGEFGPLHRGHRPSVVGVVYSDDHAHTWQRGDIVCAHDGGRIVNPSETLCVELSDGRVLLNIRNESPQHRRLVSISADGAMGWTTPEFDEALREPVCMGGLVRQSWPAGAKPGRILFANPDTLEQTMRKHVVMRDRKNLVVKLSLDDCRTWSASRVLHAGAASYCDLEALEDGTALCLYECDARPGTLATLNVTLARFDLDWLTKANEG